MPSKDTQDQVPSKDSTDRFRDSILESFSEVGDPRILSACIRHDLGNIFFITLCATLCGANKIKEIAAFAKSREKWLGTILELPYGVPCYTTIWMLFAMLDPEEFHQGFLKWVNQLVKDTAGEVLAIDGKAQRGTAVKGEPNSFVHIVSLWACDQQLTLGQVKVDGKSNEITAIPKLLELIDIAGSTITIDAMGTQTKIASQIIKSGADYVLALKGNQSKTHDEVRNFFDQAEKIDFEGIDHQVYHMTEKGHGRYEKRTIFVTENIAWLPEAGRWKGLKSIVLLISERTVNGKTSIERRLYISSLSANARRVAYAIRSHWGIESCHWILDVGFQEDSLKARAGHIAQNLSLIRKMALALLKQDTATDGGIELKRKKAGWDPDYLLDLMGIKF
jgi:predicted transposase YbfD/YdcC